MRMPIALTILLVAIVGGLIAFNAGCQKKPDSPAQPPSASNPATPPAPGQPATPEDAVGDGGAEQATDEPIPPAPETPAQPSGAGSTPVDVTFDHAGPGELLPGSGKGYLDRTVWAPDICFPIADAAFANSQVWNPGGGKGPAGSQCASSNYSLPWHDTFCEARSRDNPLCVGGSGHQGQDIRPQSCVKNTYWTVAAEDGRITNVGTYSVTLTADAPPHRQYRYLHVQMDALAVHEGTKVKKGDHIGKVSNYFGGTPTTIHLHFEIRAGVTGTSTDGKAVAVLAFLPPYLSIAQAYQRKLNGQTCQ